MASFQERIVSAFNDENRRRSNAKEPRLTKTELWTKAGRSSGACSHWFGGGNAMDWDAARKVAPLLRVNPYWLYDESKPRDEPFVETATAANVLDLGRAPLAQERRNNPKISAIIGILNEFTDDGLSEVLGYVKGVASQHRRGVKSKLAK